MATGFRNGTTVREALLALALASIPAPVLAAELAPQPVSPGRPGTLGALASRCPTFHWVPSPGAQKLELVVFQVDEAAGIQTPDAAAASPELRNALRVVLPGAAAGYTAPPGGCLARGRAYAWMLRATEGQRIGVWSEPSFFQVAAEPSADEVEHALEVLRAYRQPLDSDPTAIAAPAARNANAGAVERAEAAGDDALPIRRDERRLARPEPGSDGGIVRAAAAANAPSPTEDASITISENLRLGASSNVFKDGSVLLWDDTANNTALGRDALSSNTTEGANSTAVGANALKNNVGHTEYGSDNTAVGAFALELNTTGDRNTAVGVRALRENLGGFFNTAVGDSALRFNTGGYDNTATGAGALGGNTGGKSNSAFGRNALVFNVGGNQNTAVGAGALQGNVSASDNTAVGFSALQSSSTAFANTAVGANALRAATGSGSLNTAMGKDALRYNSTGHSNTAVGLGAAKENNTGADNVAVGLYALRASTSGSRNVAIGNAALRYLGSYSESTGSYNIAIGYGAGKNVGFGVAAGSSNIHIGNLGVNTDTSKIRIGTNQMATYVAGVYTAPMSSGGNHPVWVDSEGKLGMEPPSSRRFKEDIRDLGDDSHAILDLRPVAFRYKRRDGEQVADTPEARPLQAGLIAEEVDEVLPSLVRRDANGDPRGVDYHELIPLLLNELQRQEREIAALRKQVTQLTPERKPVRDRPRRPARDPARR